MGADNWHIGQSMILRPKPFSIQLTRFLSRAVLPLAAFCLGLPAAAAPPAPAASAVTDNVRVEQAWVRATVPGQQGTGGYMKLTASESRWLVSASSPLAGVAEIHEIKMEGDVMKMRAVPALALPAGRTVELKPGGLHLMLMDLKQPLPVGSSVPLTLVLKDDRGVESRVRTRLLVSASAPPAAAPASALVAPPKQR